MISAMTSGVTVGGCTFVSGRLFEAARESFDSLPATLREREWIKEGNAPLVCLVFSVIALEAFPDEFITRIELPTLFGFNKKSSSTYGLSEYIQENIGRRPKGTPVLAWKLSLLKGKLAGTLFRDDEQPYLDVYRLISLRNWLVHQKPWMWEGPDRSKSYPKELSALTPLNILTDVTETITSPLILLQNRAMMRWEMTTVSLMVRNMLRFIPPERDSERRNIPLSWPLFDQPAPAEETQ